MQEPKRKFSHLSGMTISIGTITIQLMVNEFAFDVET
jgi:hypothetical protein